MLSAATGERSGKWRGAHGVFRQNCQCQTQDSAPRTSKTYHVIEARIKALDSEWLFPAFTRSGRAEPSTIRDHHAKALKIAKLASFVLYTLRHTCLTKWAAHMDPYTLAYLAGYSCFSITKRYVHRQKETVLALMGRATKAASTAKSHHTPKIVRVAKSN